MRNITDVPMRLRGYWGITLTDTEKEIHFHGDESIMDQNDVADQIAYLTGEKVALVTQDEWEEFVHCTLIRKGYPFGKRNDRISVDSIEMEISRIYKADSDLSSKIEESIRFEIDMCSVSVSRNKAEDQQYFKRHLISQFYGVPVSIPQDQWLQHLEKLEQEYRNRRQGDRTEALTNLIYVCTKGPAVPLRIGDCVGLASDPDVSVRGGITEINDNHVIVGGPRSFRKYAHGELTRWIDDNWKIRQFNSLPYLKSVSYLERI